MMVRTLMSLHLHPYQMYQVDGKLGVAWNQQSGKNRSFGPVKFVHRALLTILTSEV